VGYRQARQELKTADTARIANPIKPPIPQGSPTEEDLFLFFCLAQLAGLAVKVLPHFFPMAGLGAAGGWALDALGAAP
jgi:hypothetical protein